MTGCFVPQCNHHNSRFKCTFHRFPKDENLKKLWIKNIRRKDATPTSNSRVCSCHFTEYKSGKSVPTLFSWSAEKMAKKFNFVSPEKRRYSARGLSKLRLMEASRTIMDGEEEVAARIVEQTTQDNNYLCSESDLTQKPKMCTVATETEIISVDKETQTIRSLQLEAENTLLQSQLETLKKENFFLKQQRFGWHCIEHDNTVILHYTGIDRESFFTIRSLCDEVEFKYVKRFKSSMSFTDQLLLTLMKLRLGLSYLDLSVRFCISKTTVGNIFHTYLQLLHHVLFKALMRDIPSQQKNRQCLPFCFQQFSNCRIIIDCTEFPAEIPNRFDEQRSTYSSYKHRNTVKVLVGVAPNGVVTFCSDGYPGSTSDREIVNHCGILKVLKRGDMVLADKGFLLKDLLPEGVSLNIPPFLTTTQFTPAQAEETRNIAKARIHVERAIKRIKVYRILNCIPKVWYSYASEIIQVCAALTNFRNPLIKSVADKFDNLEEGNLCDLDGDENSE